MRKAAFKMLAKRESLKVITQGQRKWRYSRPYVISFHIQVAVAYSGRMPACGVRGPRFEYHVGYIDLCLSREPQRCTALGRATHPYCSAQVDSASHSPWGGKMSIRFRAE